MLCSSSGAITNYFNGLKGFCVGPCIVAGNSITFALAKATEATDDRVCGTARRSTVVLCYCSASLRTSKKLGKRERARLLQSGRRDARQKVLRLRLICCTCTIRQANGGKKGKNKMLKGGRRSNKPSSYRASLFLLIVSRLFLPPFTAYFFPPLSNLKTKNSKAERNCLLPFPPGNVKRRKRTRMFLLEWGTNHKITMQPRTERKENARRKGGSWNQSFNKENNQRLQVYQTFIVINF